MKTEIMIDIETLAVPEDMEPGQVPEVVEIGCVKFDRHGIVDQLPPLYPQEGNGACSASTITWWMDQVLRNPAEVPAWLRHRIGADYPEELASMEACLRLLSNFIGWDENAVVWTKGAFDLPILTAHFALCRMPCPWKYWQARDLRTEMAESRVRTDRDRVSHNAVEDCCEQIRLLQLCRKARKEVAA